MWKTLILILTWSLHSNSVLYKSHLNDLRKAYQFGLLTDDYGILTKVDLKINTCDAYPQNFSEESLAYEYWQCFDVVKTKFDCNEHSFSDENNKKNTFLFITSYLNGEKHEYISRRPMNLKACNLYLKDWKKFTKNQKQVCVSGSFINSEKDETDKSKKNWNWIFGRYKTKLGCDSYFEGECYLPKKTKEYKCE